MEKFQTQTARRTQGDGMENDTTKGSVDSRNNKSSNSDDLHKTPIGSTTKTPSTSSASNVLLPLSIVPATTSSSLSSVSIPGQHSIYRAPQNTENKSLPPILPKGKIFNLIPKLIQSTSKPISLQGRKPRFVPIEPYKGAINPIVPIKKTRIKINKRNNLDLNTLVTQMSEMKTNEMLMNYPQGSIESNATNTTDLERFKLKYDQDIQNMKRERDYFESQLKFQVQVNSELKNLLVAAVGEDLQTRVNVLTEDKLQLARALLNSAENLSSHTEQIEFLAGQSEVWRSKFLASSLMVEELARWKASLLDKNKLLLNSNKQMLETLSKIRDMEIEQLKNLKFLAQTKQLNLPSSNVLDLSAECLNISEHLVLHCGFGMPDELDLNGLDSATSAEKLAVEALQNSSQPLMETEVAFRAIVGQAFSSYKQLDGELTIEKDK